MEELERQFMFISKKISKLKLDLLTVSRHALDMHKQLVEIEKDAEHIVTYADGTIFTLEKEQADASN